MDVPYLVTGYPAFGPQVLQPFKDVLFGDVGPVLVGVGHRETPAGTDVGAIYAIHFRPDTLYGLTVAGGYRNYYLGCRCLVQRFDCHVHGKAGCQAVVHQNHRPLRKMRQRPLATEQCDTTADLRPGLDNVFLHLLFT